jgi:hypothetical protein
MTRREPLSPISVAFAVALLAGCSAADQSVHPSATEATQTPTAEPTATASPSPTIEPTPTPIPAGELVLRITYAHFGSHWTARSLVADGRLTSPSESGWQVQTLSPSGVEQLRREVVGTGLFANSANYPLVPVPNQDINCTDGLGLTYSSAIELVTDEGPVIVSWQRAGGPDGCWEPTASRIALEALLTRLESAEDWLPADAWQDQTPRPYQPHSFRLITIALPRQAGVGDPPEISSVASPLVDSLTTYGDSVVPAGFAGQWTVRCGAVSPNEAELVVDALAEVGARMSDSVPSGFASATLLGDRGNEETVAVILEALPPGQFGCAQLDLGYLNCWEIASIQPFYCAIP